MRSTAKVRSSSVRNLAYEGESINVNQTIGAMTTAGAPSIKDLVSLPMSSGTMATYRSEKSVAMAAHENESV